MSEAKCTARANAKANIIVLASNISIQHDDNGCYTHDVAKSFHSLFLLQLGACYNDIQLAEGMRKLIDKGDNALTAIKSMDCITADTILVASKKEAATLKHQTGMDEEPKFDSCAEAKVEVDNSNYAIQATIGTKEGATKGITTIVGLDIMDNVLCHADGTPKGVDEYCLHKLFNAVAAAGKCPMEKELLTLKVNTFYYKFDWCKTISVNKKQFRLQVNKLTAYNLSFDINDRILVILNKANEANHHYFGCDLHTCYTTPDKIPNTISYTHIPCQYPQNPFCSRLALQPC